jgi:toxin ParE1/3/4
MTRVIYAPAAEDDLASIIEYISQDNPEAARCLARMICEKCEAHATHPMMGEERPGFGVPGCRCFSVDSYVVFFRPILDNDGGIEVARIVHGSRDLRNL